MRQKQGKRWCGDAILAYPQTCARGLDCVSVCASLFWLPPSPIPVLAPPPHNHHPISLQAALVLAHTGVTGRFPSAPTLHARRGGGAHPAPAADLAGSTGVAGNPEGRGKGELDGPAQMPSLVAGVGTDGGSRAVAWGSGVQGRWWRQVGLAVLNGTTFYTYLLMSWLMLSRVSDGEWVGVVRVKERARASERG